MITGNRSLLAVLLFWAPVAGRSVGAQQRPQPPLQTQYDSAYFAWEIGDYPSALVRLERLLAAPGGDGFLEPVALLTGELYRTLQVAPDGANLRWSGDGRFASYTTSGGRVTHILAVEGDSMRPVARLEGVGAVLSPEGSRVAYFAIRDTPELRAARALADSLIRARDFGRLQQQRVLILRMEREAAQVILRDLRSGQERALQVPDLAKTGLAFAPDGWTLYFVGGIAGDTTRSDIFAIADVDGAATVRTVAEGPGLKQNVIAPRGSDWLVYTIGVSTIGVRNLGTGETRTFDGLLPAVSADGSLLTWLTRSESDYTIRALALRVASEPVVLKRSARPLATPAPSPDGQRVAYAMRLRDDWEIYVVGANGQGDTRITREIQHDRFPRWLGTDRILAMKGEPRHTRSYIYELRTGSARRLHHNNTVRTVAPEYDWAPSPDATKVLIVADRDGDTISPERGVYLVNLERPVTLPEVLARVRASLAAERDLRDRGRRMYVLMDAAVRAAVRDVSVARIYDYENALFKFDSKYITQPGNRLAIDYIANTLRSFGYGPELQWFEPRPGVRTANVVATLRGTTNPELIYVVSSHFDSVQPGPGADDNTSGTTVLLDAARVLAARPQPATIKFAWFTGEEGGLLGSREFVRRAVATKDQIVGALNNDMIGWANDHRLDNTIRYSNAGIRDLQHAAAFLFTDLITYDSRYYQSTDAAAYYEAYGDIVGGIGSYPILGNPHYHQPDDILETINHRLVAEVSKTTVASIMLLASSPSRLKGLEILRTASGVEARWTPAAEKGVVRYLLTYGPPNDPTLRTLTLTRAQATLPAAAPAWVVAVKAVNRLGLQSWDWARGTVPQP